MQELEQLLNLKGKEMKMKEEAQAKKHKVELQELQDGYDEQLDDAH